MFDLDSVVVIDKTDVMNAIAGYINTMANADIVIGELSDVEIVHGDIEFAAHKMNIILDPAEVKAFTFMYYDLTYPYFPAA